MLLRADNVDIHQVRQRSFCASLATMSVIGYILGLGDRHCENLLFDFDSAEVG